MDVNAEIIESQLFSQSKDESPKCIFILGSPRTGSTILYQTLVDCFQTGYIANITNNYFSKFPAIGFALQSIAAKEKKFQISSVSKFGKTEGEFQPSEGSFVMKNWFGGDQPSQTKSAHLLPGMAEHLVNTIKYANYTFKKPLVIKNAWNCYRIAALSELFPDAKFVWIKRSIEKCAKSDLLARYQVHNDPCHWNSATPSNIDMLKSRPYWEQVVENQFEMNQAIKLGLGRIANHRFSELWYEDFCQSPEKVLSKIGCDFLLINAKNPIVIDDSFQISRSPARYQLSEQDINHIDNYIKNNVSRFQDYTFKDAVVHETS